MVRGTELAWPRSRDTTARPALAGADDVGRPRDHHLADRGARHGPRRRCCDRLARRAGLAGPGADSSTSRRLRAVAPDRMPPDVDRATWSRRVPSARRRGRRPGRHARRRHDPRGPARRTKARPTRRPATPTNGAPTSRPKRDPDEAARRPGARCRCAAGPSPAGRPRVPRTGRRGSRATGTVATGDATDDEGDAERAGSATASRRAGRSPGRPSTTGWDEQDDRRDDRRQPRQRDRDEAGSRPTAT